LPSVVSLVEVFSRERDAGFASGRRLRQERLHDVDPTSAKTVRARRHVELPDPVSPFPNQFYRIQPTPLETAQPGAKRQEVVLAQALDVPDLESNALRASDYAAQRNEPGVWKHVLVDELVALPKPAAESLEYAVGAPCCTDADLTMIQKEPTRLERPENSREILSKRALTGRSRKSIIWTLHLSLNPFAAIVSWAKIACAALKVMPVAFTP